MAGEAWRTRSRSPSFHSRISIATLAGLTATSSIHYGRDATGPSADPTVAEPMESIEVTLGLTSKDGPLRKWRWIALAAIIVIAIVAIYLGVFRSPATGVAYRTDTVRRGSLTLSVTATGRVEPLTQVAVGTEISGIIEEVLVDVNDRVRAGQVLARVNTDKLAAQVEQSRAALRSAEAALAQTQATLREARSTLARATQLGEYNTAVEREAAQTAAARAEADEIARNAAIAQSRAMLAAVESDLTRATIRSPINGVVLDRQVDPGQTVAASFQTPTLFVIAEDLTQMQLSVDVDEADIGRVKIGQPATFTVDAYPDSTFKSKVENIGNLSQTSGGVVTYVTLLSVSNPDLLLKPGMTATADVTVAQVDDVLLVPNTALRFVPEEVIAAEARAVADTATARTGGRSGGGVFGGMRPPGRASSSAAQRPLRVWVLRDGRPVEVAVRTGATDGIMTEIVGGDLEAGTEVIVDVALSTGI